MDDDEKREIALWRLGVLGPLMSARLEHGDRRAYFEQAASRTHEQPDGRLVRLSARTIEAWFYVYRLGGFEALVPKTRSDRHTTRAIGDEVADLVVAANGTMFGVGFMSHLMQHPYQLGVRELARLIWQHLTTPEVSLEREGRRDETSLLAPSGPAIDGPEARSRAAGDELTAARIQRCLDENNGAVELTWRALGLKNRFALLRAIKKHGLEIRRRPGQGSFGRAR